ncbi:uncharacterized protein LOC132645662 isoform X1 [Lycium barbarum]|uniref:uncharacterized protein LOC132645662 isoform X1 n=1 Tax=Lycium barbarum TaxID=112863 RepID=UPI00293E822E|nr:uncharacterized protein LOC132645662 isoform X1 [Lycium barbarum]
MLTNLITASVTPELMVLGTIFSSRGMIFVFYLILLFSKTEELVPKSLLTLEKSILPFCYLLTNGNNACCRHRDILSGRRNVSILEIIMLHETLTSFKYSQYEDSVQLEYLQNCRGFLVTTALAYGNENTPVN